MLNAKDITIDNLAFKCLTIGDTGRGKTTFLSTFPKLRCFDFDGGLTSVRGRDFEYITYEDEEQGTTLKRPTAFDRFWSDWQEALKDEELESLGIDSLSSLSECLMNTILTNNNLYGKKPNWDHYEIFGSRMIRLLNTIKHAEKNIIVTAHPAMIKNDVSGALFVGPSIKGRKSLDPLKQTFDEVYIANVEVVKGERVYSLQTVGNEYTCAKSRLAGSAGLLDIKEVPDYSYLISKIKEGEKKGGSLSN